MASVTRITPRLEKGAAVSVAPFFFAELSFCVGILGPTTNSQNVSSLRF